MAGADGADIGDKRPDRAADAGAATGAEAEGGDDVALAAGTQAARPGTAADAGAATGAEAEGGDDAALAAGTQAARPGRAADAGAATGAEAEGGDDAALAADTQAARPGRLRGPFLMSRMAPKDLALELEAAGAAFATVTVLVQLLYREYEAGQQLHALHMEAAAELLEMASELLLRRRLLPHWPQQHAP